MPARPFFLFFPEKANSNLWRRTAGRTAGCRMPGSPTLDCATVAHTAAVAHEHSSSNRSSRLFACELADASVWRCSPAPRCSTTVQWCYRGARKMRGAAERWRTSGQCARGARRALLCASRLLLVLVLLVGASASTPPYATAALHRPTALRAGPFTCCTGEESCGGVVNSDVECSSLGDLYYATNGGSGWLDASGWSDAAAGVPTDLCGLFGFSACARAGGPLTELYVLQSV